MKLVERVRSVGDKLSEEDLFVGVKRVDHEIQQAGSFRLKFVGFSICSSGHRRLRVPSDLVIRKHPAAIAAAGVAVQCTNFPPSALSGRLRDLSPRAQSNRHHSPPLGSNTAKCPLEPANRPVDLFELIEPEEPNAKR